MNYLIYKITNKINSKYYIGAHRTKDINDSYMGSGTVIRRAINKYGVDQFTKEIIQTCESENEMFETEHAIIGDLWESDHLCYNAKPGGAGGWGHIDSSGENNPMRNKDVAKKVSDSLRKKYAEDEEYAKDLRKSFMKATMASAKKRKGQKDSQETKDKRANSVSSYHRSQEPKFLLIDPNGNEYRYATLSECCEIHDLNRNLLKKWIDTGLITQHPNASRISETAKNTYGWSIQKLTKNSI